MKILLVITSLGLGGAESQVVALAENFRKRGLDVFVICMIPLGENAKKIIDVGGRVFSLNMTPGKIGARAFFEFAKLVHKIKPDIVHSHMFHANLLCRFLRLIRVGPPLVSTAHSIDECKGSTLRYWAYRLTRDFSSYNTNVSAAAFDRYCDIGLISPTKGEVVYNGVDFSKFKIKPSAQKYNKSKFVWVSVGRLVEAKDYPNLFCAVKILKEKKLDFVVKVVGDGPLKNKLESIIVEQGIEEYIEMIGPSQEIPEILSSADAFVMSSSWEGLPMALLEATACGLPAVVTDVGGNREVIDLADNGYYVPARAPLSLAESMLSVMSMPSEQLVALGSRGSKNIKMKFDIESISACWFELYSRFVR